MHILANISSRLGMLALSIYYDIYLSSYHHINCYGIHICRYSIGNSDLLNGITHGWLYTLSQMNKAPYTYTTISRNLHNFESFPLNLSNYIRASYSSSSTFSAPTATGNDYRSQPQHLYELQVLIGE